MATCSLLGQAMGNAAALCVKYGCTPRDISKNHIAELQQEILYDGVFLPNVKREIPLLSKKARLNIPDSDREILFCGTDRPRECENENGILLNPGDDIIFTFDEPQSVRELRLQLDPDYSRESVSKNFKMRVFAQRLHTGLDFEPMKTAATIVKEITVYGDGKEIFRDSNNYYSFRRIPIDGKYSQIRVVFGSTHGAEKVCIFGCDIR